MVVGGFCWRVGSMISEHDFLMSSYRRFPAGLIIVCVMLTVLHPVFAYYGARFEPPDGTIYHGCGWNGFGSQVFYDSMFPVEHHPLILQAMMEMPGTRGMDVARVIQSLTMNIVHPDSQFTEFGVHFRDRNGMLDSVFALTTTMDNYIDTLAAAFQAVNRPFFLRIGFEFNGDWNPYHPYIFPMAFRKLVTELHTRGIDNFATVWCYEPDAPADFADSIASGWKWYPGDDMVDWFGLDPFDQEHFNPALPDSERNELTKKGRTEAFLRFAEQRHKPVYLNELSARNVNMVPDSLDANHTEGQADWEYWFAPFFQFVHNHPGIKGWNYVNLDWRHYDVYQTWGDARLEINSYIRDHWVDSLMSARFLNVGYDITLSASNRGAQGVSPQSLLLYVFPNPFNPRATIQFAVPRAADVSVDVFDVLGRHVTTVWSGTLTAGTHAVLWEGMNCASGVYLIRVKAGNQAVFEKALLMK